ncbi:hypothetical protein GT972_05400 [Sinimarinibacterium sp. NLF-5-8]|nr:hypothetical protein GT972_05400 [Sinimarinibacterium sp. NLF-5-8]
MTLPATPYSDGNNGPYARSDTDGGWQGSISFVCKKNVSGPMGTLPYGWVAKAGTETCAAVAPECPAVGPTIYWDGNTLRPSVQCFANATLPKAAVGATKRIPAHNDSGNSNWKCEQQGANAVWVAQSGSCRY